MSFWLFGNYQMFIGQKADALLTINTIIPSHHTLRDIYSGLLNFSLSTNENLLLATFLAVASIFALLTLS